MINPSGLRRAAALFLLAAPTLCLAVDTHVWEQSEQSEFARGTPKNLSIRSDGHVTLGPEFKELDSTNEPYLWAIAQDSKETLYYAGGAPTGATAKIYALMPGGKPKVFAELTGLEVHALAIDAQDRVYAAVLPDAKIYRIAPGGKPELFFDAKCKYVWSMAFDRAGDLFVATGDAGIIYKVTPDGKGAPFFDTQETHVRSMTIDAEGNLIVGTEPGGLIIRITPQGQGFVLYQANRREVTAVAERGGVVYAAAVGNKPLSVPVPAPAPVAPVNPPPVTGAGAPRAGANPPPALPPPIGSLTTGVAGGSEVYRIQKDGFAERIWNSGADVVYAIGFDGAGKPLLGSGNKGIVYRVDSDQLSTELLNTPPTQVTAFLQGKNGLVYAATGNVGNLYSIGPGLQASGTLASEVLDANDFAHWGKAHLTSQLHGGAISVETRSGNLNHPENNWSPWGKVAVSELGGPVQSPAARFLQYRLTLTKSPAGESPELSVVDIAYLPKNAAPKVGQIELAPFNYRQAPSTQGLERSTQPSGSPTSLTLPAVGQRRSAPSSSLETSAGSTLQYAKGFVTARWNASDANGDPLLFKVEIRAKNESVWRLLKDRLLDRYFAFDSSALPDGSYVVRVTASDEPGNTPTDTLTSSLESDSFIVDNTPPEIANISVSKNAVKFTAKDALSWIDKAEYSLNGGEWILLTPDNLVTDSQVLNYTVPAKEGDLIAVRVFDEDDNVGVNQVTVKP